jgi:hypothetical protein
MRRDFINRQPAFMLHVIPRPRTVGFLNGNSSNVTGRVQKNQQKPARTYTDPLEDLS